MLDVFTEEVEVLIKDGVANLYWYKSDLHKAWVRSGVSIEIKNNIAASKGDQNRDLSKREQMDMLYEKLRTGDYNRRLEISRNFVRILIDQKGFAPQSEKHRIEVAERCSLKLRIMIDEQEKNRQYKDSIRASAEKATRDTFESKLADLRVKFSDSHSLAPQKKGYLLEEIFNDLMLISGTPVEEPFKIDGEQFDGAIKYDGNFYLIELKWTESKSDPKEISHFYYKVDGKMQARGIFISMNGFTPGVMSTLPKGKELKVLLMDGTHIANSIYGLYKFQELLEHAIKQASLKGDIYCSHNLEF